MSVQGQDISEYHLSGEQSSFIRLLISYEPLISEFLIVFCVCLCVSGAKPAWLGSVFVCVWVPGSVCCGYSESVEVI